MSNIYRVFAKDFSDEKNRKFVAVLEINPNDGVITLTIPTKKEAFVFDAQAISSVEVDNQEDNSVAFSGRTSADEEYQGEDQKYLFFFSTEQKKDAFMSNSKKLISEAKNNVQSSAAKKIIRRSTLINSDGRDRLRTKSMLAEYRKSIVQSMSSEQAETNEEDRQTSDSIGTDQKNAGGAPAPKLEDGVVEKPESSEGGNHSPQESSKTQVEAYLFNESSEIKDDASWSHESEDGEPDIPVNMAEAKEHLSPVVMVSRPSLHQTIVEESSKNSSLDAALRSMSGSKKTKSKPMSVDQANRYVRAQEDTSQVESTVTSTDVEDTSDVSSSVTKRPSFVSSIGNPTTRRRSIFELEDEESPEQRHRSSINNHDVTTPNFYEPPVEETVRTRRNSSLNNYDVTKPSLYEIDESKLPPPLPVSNKLPTYNNYKGPEGNADMLSEHILKEIHNLSAVEYGMGEQFLHDVKSALELQQRRAQELQTYKVDGANQDTIIEEQRLKIGELQAYAMECNDEISTLKEAKKNLENDQVKSLMATIEQQKLQIDRLEASTLESTSEIEALKDSNKDLKEGQEREMIDTIEEQKARIQELEVYSMECYDELKRVNESKSELSATIEQQQQQLEELKSYSMECNKEIEVLNESRLEIERAKEEERNEFMLESDKATRKFKDEVKALKQKNKDLTFSLQNLKANEKLMKDKHSDVQPLHTILSVMWNMLSTVDNELAHFESTELPGFDWDKHVAQLKEKGPSESNYEVASTDIAIKRLDTSIGMSIEQIPPPLAKAGKA